MVDALTTITNVINSPPGQIAAGGVLVGMVWKFFERVEVVLTGQRMRSAFLQPVARRDGHATVRCHQVQDECSWEFRKFRQGHFVRTSLLQHRSGLLKATKIRERMTLQFRAEFFDVFNNVKFQPPGSNISSSTVGRITSVVVDSFGLPNSERIIQLGLKLSF